MIACTILLFFCCLAIAVYSRQYYMWCGVLFMFGLLCMVFANTLYMQILTNVYFNSGSPDQFIIKLANLFSLSISNTRIISLFGEVVILISFTLIFTKHIRKKMPFYLVTAIYICFYVWSGLPDVMFGFWLRLNSESIAAVRSAELMLKLIYIVRLLMLIYFMTAPYVLCIYKYVKTSFITIKRNMLNVMLYTGAIEIILLLCTAFNVINNFAEVIPSIFYKENLPEVYRIGGYMPVLLLLIVIYACILVLRGKMASVYYMKASTKGIYGKNQVDKNIKMILHSYKNMFFAVRQLSDKNMYDDELSAGSETMISTIHSIADNALYRLTKQIKMLDEIDIEIEKFKISALIRMALDKCTPEEKRIISVDYMTDKQIINSDIFYLSDAIYNILKNAVEASADKEDARICVTVKYEDDWFLIDVTDNGCGIERDQMKKIFKPLVSYKHGSGNWGIGLYYSHRIINTLKGCICLKSKPGEYTSFQIYMPQNIKNKNRKNTMDGER